MRALQEQIAAASLDVLAATQRAWFDCVAANQRVAVRRSIAEAAQLAADLALQYREAGNVSALEVQVQRAEASQSRIALHDAQMQLADARAELQKQLGLAFSQSAWTVPESLPEVPQDADAGNAGVDRPGAGSAPGYLGGQAPRAGTGAEPRRHASLSPAG